MWGIAPSEFLQMTPREFWLICDAKVGDKAPASNAELDELLAFIDEED